MFIYFFSLFSLISAVKYNILALDGGAIKGMITQQCMMNIEWFAFDYAKEKGYKIPIYENSYDKSGRGRMHLKDIFDMMAGTSAGSMNAAGLSIPKYNKTNTNEP